MPAALPKLIAIVGPTASGKTDLAIALAKKFRGEIISADSRQFYRGTDIGSDIIPGKWVKRGRRRVYVARGIPHHLLSFRPVSRPVTAAEFQKLAIRLARDIARRGRVPIVAGGTGLYIRTIVDNLDIPPVAPRPDIRARLEERTTAKLYAWLKKLDPAYAVRIPAQNRRYIVRALEVIGATGRPFSEQQRAGEPLFDVLQLGVKRPRPEIYRRIDARVDLMIKNGLIDEAKRLAKRFSWDLPAMSALGHRQLGLFLEGKVPLEEAVRLIKRDTRHYAKRQLTWFGRDKRIQWVKDQASAFKLAGKFLSC